MNFKTMVIDDDEISIMLTNILLEDSSTFQEIGTYMDGKYALEFLKAEYSKDAHYIIFLDINMPLMNGWEFLDEIKNFTSQQNTSVFMLSSSTDKLDIDKANDVDLVKGFFSKPLKKENLNKIQKLISE